MYIYKTMYLLQDLGSSERRCWTANSAMWRCVVGRPLLDVSEDCTAFVSKVRQSKNNHWVNDPDDEGNNVLRKVVKSLRHRRPKSESNFLSSAPKFPKEHCFFWKVRRSRPLVLLLRATCSWRWVRSNGGMILTGENWSTGGRTCQSDTLHKAKIFSVSIVYYCGQNREQTRIL